MVKLSFSHCRPHLIQVYFIFGFRDDFFFFRTLYYKPAAVVYQNMSVPINKLQLASTQA